jgi:tetratricopeptide (TPR) repeat protein
LTLDYYDWPISRGWGQITWGWIVAALILATAVALWKKPWLGFLGAWFFLILAPSSSVVPIVTEIAAEHRMYLSLAAPIALVMVGGYMILNRWRWSVRMGHALSAAVLAGLAGASLFRNHQYASPLGMWRYTVAQRPGNARAHFNLGSALLYSGADGGMSEVSPQVAQEAVEQFYIGLQEHPAHDLALKAARSIGQAMENGGQLLQAEQFYTEAMRTYPEFRAEACVKRGRLRGRRSDWNGAAADFQAAIAIDPDNPIPHFLLGTVHLQTQDWSKAESEFKRTLQLRPGFPGAAEYLRQTQDILLRGGQ